MTSTSPAAADATCQHARQIMVRLRPRLDETPERMMMVLGVIEVEAEHFPDRVSFEAAAHVEDCTACQQWREDWLDEEFPERVAHRERFSKYCCVTMYRAITHPDADVRFSFEMFRGEDACWLIDDKYAFAHFCPWCGQALPDHPFEPEPTP
ncbi:hypothetical protein [Xanthomonas medicagonis]|uniref:hypothetical protein n=1 Tax=Xanthomonas medicagonis TaxID=3160841 RepID=UPI003510E91C